jgi:hypothetical protein
MTFALSVDHRNVLRSSAGEPVAVNCNTSKGFPDAVAGDTETVGTAWTYRVKEEVRFLPSDTESVTLPGWHGTVRVRLLTYEPPLQDRSGAWFEAGSGGTNAAETVMGEEHEYTS